MREILFQGKRVDNGEWVEGDLVRHYENQRRFIACNQLAYTYTECDISRLVSEDFFEVIPETVGQWTGLKDKNGTKIFEGDIVKTTALSNDHHQRGATWVSPVGYWQGNACLTKTDVPIYSLCVNHEIEVIGNIHNDTDPDVGDKEEAGNPCMVCSEQAYCDTTCPERWVYNQHVREGDDE